MPIPAGAARWARRRLGPAWRRRPALVRLWRDTRARLDRAPVTDRSATADVVIATASRGRRLQFPGATRVDDQTIIVVVREGTHHVSPDGRIVAVLSRDRGRSWSRPRVVHDSGHDARDPMISRLDGGHLIMSWFEIDHRRSPRRVVGTFTRTSDDGGATWSPPRRVGSRLHGPSTLVDVYELGWAASHGPVRQASDGGLLIPLYGTVPDDRWQRATVVRSSDGGRSWPADGEAVIAHRDGTHYQEPVLTVLPDGRVHALLRVGAGPSTMAALPSQESWSSDGGRSWSPPVELALITSSAATVLLDDGRVVLAYGDLSKQLTPRRGTVAAVISGDTASWHDPPRALVYDSGTGDQANPAVVVTGPDELLVIGFDTATARVVGRFVGLDDLAGIDEAGR